MLINELIVSRTYLYLERISDHVHIRHIGSRLDRNLCEKLTLLPNTELAKMHYSWVAAILRR